jgi:hypothetical protein
MTKRVDSSIPEKGAQPAPLNREERYTIASGGDLIIAVSTAGAPVFKQLNESPKPETKEKKT